MRILKLEMFKTDARTFVRPRPDQVEAVAIQLQSQACKLAEEHKDDPSKWDLIATMYELAVDAYNAACSCAFGRPISNSFVDHARACKMEAAIHREGLVKRER